MNDIKIYAEELGAKSYKKGKPWKGYNVYVPVYSEETYIGLPYVILEKGDEVRICTDKEAMEYLSFSLRDSDEMKPNDKLTGLGENE